MIDQLRQLIPVPGSPVDTDDSALPAVENLLNVRFPDDYLEYSRTYGSGTISVGPYSWKVFSPFRSDFPEFVKTFVEIQDECRRAMETMDLGLGLFPEPGGLLPFGRRDDVHFCWKTHNQPEAWTIVVIWTYQKGGYQAFDMGFGGFLVKLLTRQICVAGYTSPWEPNEITFKSLRASSS